VYGHAYVDTVFWKKKSTYILFLFIKTGKCKHDDSLLFSFWTLLILLTFSDTWLSLSWNGKTFDQHLSRSFHFSGLGLLGPLSFFFPYWRATWFGPHTPSSKHALCDTCVPPLVLSWATDMQHCVHAIY
jgi:hypothetical protein